ncbi:MAG: glycerol-3-phosphate 1-O-acyltransferase PlsY [Proteocatella sp.]
MYNMKIIIPLIIMSYLIGNISPSVIIGRKFKNIDIRQHGSGNAGTTNAMRILGKKAGILVFLLDFIKGVIPTVIGLCFGGLELGFVCGISAIIGHIFPILLKFKGGKGVATSFGVGLVLAPAYALIGLLIFIIIVIKTRYISLGSVIGTLTFPILQIFTTENIQVVIMSVLLGCLVTYSHRANIKRLINGTESKFGVPKN